MSLRPQADEPPARAPWPPILMALALLAGLALDRLSGGAFKVLADFPASQLLGVLIVAIALANDIWCARLFARHNTTILPHRAASHLVTEGPFRWSRNPIYVSHVALVFGLGLLLSSSFTLLSTPLLALLLQKLSIEPEERRLTAKFQDQYLAYMAHTRRWL
jgi:protein-S-isoprenylcysteine O-methyltransferase Ste14